MKLTLGRAEPESGRTKRGRRLDDVIESWASLDPRRLAHWRQARRRVRQRKIGKAVLLSTLVASSFLALYWNNVVNGSHCGVSPSSSEAPTRIALIDSLALEYPNARFVKRISLLARAHAYSFDYYPPERSTVDDFVHLPEKGYSMIIFRTHGTGNLPVIVTSEPYSAGQRQWDQLSDRTGRVDVNGREYFGVMSNFITNAMCGRFPDTIVLAMGCLTMGSDLPVAFVDKGAKAFIGWNGMVTLPHTEFIFEGLVELLLEDNPLGVSVHGMTGNSGLDPETGAHLSYYSR